MLIAKTQSGPVSYRDLGEGPPVVFVHGVLVNGELWRNVAPPVSAAGYRCLVPDWPLGGHTQPMHDDADLTPAGVAGVIRDFLDALDLHDVTLVANDSGVAITQLVLASAPARVARAVLTSGDAFEYFFPPRFRALSMAAHAPGGTWITVQLLRVAPLHRLPNLFGQLTKRPIPAEVMRSYLEPSRRSALVRRDLRKFLRGVDRRVTLAVAKDLKLFDGPVLLAWAEGDPVFPESLARRLADAFADARIELIDDSYAFVPEDQPAALAELIVKFARG